MLAPTLSSFHSCETWEPKSKFRWWQKLGHPKYSQKKLGWLTWRSRMISMKYIWNKLFQVGNKMDHGAKCLKYLFMKWSLFSALGILKLSKIWELRLVKKNLTVFSKKICEFSRSYDKMWYFFLIDMYCNHFYNS